MMTGSRKYVIAVCLLLAVGAFLYFSTEKVSQEIRTGSDIPVTVERLAESRLVGIGGTVSWEFKGPRVVIENDGNPILSDVAEAILAEPSTPRRIEATWKLDEQAEQLQLSDFSVDGQAFERKVAIEIGPAGQVRVNLGGRQYNMFQGVTNKQ